MQCSGFSIVKVGAVIVFQNVDVEIFFQLKFVRLQQRKENRNVKIGLNILIHSCNTF